MKKIIIGIISFFCSLILLTVGYSILSLIYRYFIGLDFLGGGGEGSAFLSTGLILFVFPILSIIFSIFIAWKTKKAIIIILVLLFLSSLLILTIPGIKDYKEESKNSIEQRNVMVELDSIIKEVANNPGKKICFFDFNEEVYSSEKGEKVSLAELNDCSNMPCIDSSAPIYFENTHVSIWMEKEDKYNKIVASHQKDFHLFNFVEDSKIGNLKIHNSIESGWHMLILTLDYTGIYKFELFYVQDIIKDTKEDLGKISEYGKAKEYIKKKGCNNGFYLENIGKDVEGKQTLLVIDTRFG